MKIQIKASFGGASYTSPKLGSFSSGKLGTRVTRPSDITGFTMVEIAICLAIIGFALVAIIGVLPIGMNTQRDNREETIINQDATMFIEAIRNGARGLDDLTNYVYNITNYWTQYNPIGVVPQIVQYGVNTYSYTNETESLNGQPFLTAVTPFRITNGLRIVGLLSTPEYMSNGVPIPTVMFGGISNHIVASVYSMSGPAVEKPPQPSDSIIRQDSFGYRILCVNAPAVVDTNNFTLAATNPAYIYNQQLAANLHELRLTFLWPQLANGNVGPGRQTFRTMVAGQIALTNDPAYGPMPLLYFYQPQSFNNAP
jgi:type II secretory pathway pseudopilin PulG